MILFIKLEKLVRKNSKCFNLKNYYFFPTNSSSVLEIIIFLTVFFSDPDSLNPDLGFC
jgi:hypothetical protein